MILLFVSFVFYKLNSAFERQYYYLVFIAINKVHIDLIGYL